MARRRDMWLVSLPLAAAGWLAAHCLAYLLVGSPAGHHERMHNYFVAAPVLIACGITALAAGVAITAHHGFRGGAPARIPLMPIALVPPLGFAVQEHLEHLIELNAIPLAVAVEPTFLVGMALQLPVALAVVALARAVSALGYALGRGLAGRRRQRRPRPIVAPLRALPALVRPSVLATCHGERAPPAG
jgi:hypothetical protein